VRRLWTGGARRRAPRLRQAAHAADQRGPHDGDRQVRGLAQHVQLGHALGQEVAVRNVQLPPQLQRLRARAPPVSPARSSLLATISKELKATLCELDKVWLLDSFQSSVKLKDSARYRRAVLRVAASPARRRPQRAAFMQT